MSQENVFLFYSYAEAVNKTLQVALQFSNNNKVEPEVISKLQLQTVSLEQNISKDFILIKFILSNINSSFALWVHTGIPNYFILGTIMIILNILLEILSNNYTTLATESGFNFNDNEVKFILIGQTLENIKNNAVQLVKSSINISNYSKDDVLSFANESLNTRFSVDDINSIMKKLLA